MWRTIRGYLTFTKKERFGVLLLLLLVSVLFLLPYYFRPSVGDPDPAAYKSMKDSIRKFQATADRSGDSAGTRVLYAVQKNATTGFRSVKMFYFDPNVLQVADWMRLGLSAGLSERILKYVSRGGHFRNPSDLQKLYGLHTDDYERLLPYVRIPETRPLKRSEPAYSAFDRPRYTRLRAIDSLVERKMSYSNDDPFYHAKKFQLLDVNQADETAWAALPGIGGKLAQRIVHFRDKLGGFYQVDQVAETFGLPDSTYQKMKPYLQLGNFTLHPVALNRASREELQAHPYIRWQLARTITDYRDQHGGFKTIDELQQLGQLDAAHFEKLRPYLTLQ